MFEQQRHLIEDASARLQELPVESAHIGCLVLEGLRCVCEQAETFDTCVAEDMPFVKHFFNELASLPQDDGSHWMNLLEDLALIFRAKQLTFSALPQQKGESALLAFFEGSGEWTDRGTLVATWYWKNLPERLSH